MKYLWLILKHKWFVLLAGLRLGVPIWQLIAHDWTKLLPCELPHYQRQFFGNADRPDQFIRCWAHHQNSNKHHWEYWIPRTGHSRCDPPYLDGQPIPMPMRYVREMVADWMAAGRAYEGRWPDVHDWTWLNNSRDRMRLHPRTAARLNNLLLALRGGREGV